MTDPIRKLKEAKEARRIQADPRYRLLDPLINFANDAANFAWRKHCIDLYPEWKRQPQQ